MCGNLVENMMIQFFEDNSGKLAPLEKVRPSGKEKAMPGPPLCHAYECNSPALNFAIINRNALCCTKQNLCKLYCSRPTCFNYCS